MGVGRGSILLQNGDIYEGEFKDGVAHGRGSLHFSDGDAFFGEFKKGFTELCRRYVCFKRVLFLIEALPKGTRMAEKFTESSR